MRRRAVAAAAAVLLLLAGCDGGPKPPTESNVDVNTPKLREMKAEAGIEPCEPGPGGGAMPDLTLPCLGGGEDVDLSSLRGPMLINLWASNCGPCQDEMPVLQEFHETYGDQVAVLGIDVTDTYPEAAISLAEDTGATYPQLADPGGTIYSQTTVPVKVGLPQFIVLDADGQVVGQDAGGVDELAEVEALVTEKLGIELR